MAVDVVRPAGRSSAEVKASDKDACAASDVDVRRAEGTEGKPAPSFHVGLSLLGDRQVSVEQVASTRSYSSTGRRPIRRGPMLALPRGSATVIARDLMAILPTGLVDQACVNAHMSNLGAYRKGSVEVSQVPPSRMVLYAELHGWPLPRVHASSGDPAKVVRYLGAGPVFDNPIAAPAYTHADPTERDQATLAEAVKSGCVNEEFSDGS
jgi:hypothetical protein